MSFGFQLVDVEVVSLVDELFGSVTADEAVGAWHETFVHDGVQEIRSPHIYIVRKLDCPRILGTVYLIGYLSVEIAVVA